MIKPLNVGLAVSQPATTPATDLALILDTEDRLEAGKLCLEFANSADWHAAEIPTETLTVYADLVAWAARVGLLTDQEAQQLTEQGQAQPRLAQQILAWAIDLREAIYRIFVALAFAQPVDPADLAVLNDALPSAFAGPELVAQAGGFSWRWRGDHSGLDRVLWPVLRSAARLLVDGDPARIGQCADDRGCGYLFYDTSRNRSRRWCDMNACGNRAKARRHYARRNQPAANA